MLRFLQVEKTEHIRSLFSSFPRYSMLETQTKHT